MTLKTKHFLFKIPSQFLLITPIIYLPSQYLLKMCQRQKKEVFVFLFFN